MVYKEPYQVSMGILVLIAVLVIVAAIFLSFTEAAGAIIGS